MRSFSLLCTIAAMVLAFVTTAQSGSSEHEATAKCLLDEAQKYISSEQTALALAPYIGEKCFEMHPPKLDDPASDPPCTETDYVCQGRHLALEKNNEEYQEQVREINIKYAYNILVELRREAAAAAASGSPPSSSGIPDNPAAIQVTQKSCPTVLEKHGYLSRAQFQCGFSSYASNMIEAAKSCSGIVAAMDIKLYLLHGMRGFDRDEHKLGHTAVCERTLKRYPTIVQP